jgi:hypothetical protein
MTKPKFTPGPWIVVGSGFSDDKPVVYYEISMNGKPKISKANAKLIESSPDLYEALKEAEWIEFDCETYMCPSCGYGKQEGHGVGCKLNAALKKAVGE